MEDIVDGLKKVFSERLGSPMYGTFILAWCITNWKFIYTLLFLDEANILSQTGMLKNNYLGQMYNIYSFWQGVRIISKLILIPVLMVVLYYYGPLHQLEKGVYKRYIQNRNAKKRIRLQEEKQTEATKKEILKVKEENIEKEKKVEKTVSHTWDNEYEELAKKSLFGVSMDKLKIVIYEFGGDNNGVNDGYGNWSNLLNPDEIAFLDANGICKTLDAKNQLSLTDKGRHMMKIFINK